MKNIHLLQTSQPSRLWTNNLRRRLELDEFPEQHPNNIANHIYITSDEEIKEGDWHFKITNNSVSNYKLDSINPNKGRYKKIILTTDQNLIKDGVQSIDDEFLEWFVKNPSCESVEVIPLRKSSGWYDEKEVWHWDFLAYKIIIPREEPKQETLKAAMYILQNSTYGAMGKVCDEEPKQETLTYTEAVKKEERIFNSIMMKQETLEEAAKRLYEYQSQNPPYTIITPKAKIEGFIEGAKWQQERMYSEEEVLDIINSFEKLCYNYQNNKDWFPAKKSEWFEQFKKK